MPAFEHNLQRILIFDPEKSRSTVSVFFDEVATESSEASYHLFMLSEIKTTEHAENQYAIRELQNIFSSFFHSTDQRMSETFFEEGLHELNKRIPEILADHSPEWRHAVTLVAGCVYGNIIHISQSGPVSILYMHQGQIQDIAEQPVTQSVNPLKVFRDVVTGKLEEQDAMFVGTTNFLDYFSQEKIRRIILENNEGSIAKAFDQYLLQAPSTTAFAAVSLNLKQGKLINVDELPLMSRTAQKPVAKIRSMEELIMREQATDEILTPRLFPYLKRLTKKTTRALQQFFRKHVQRKPTRISPVILEREQAEEQQTLAWRRPTIHSKPSIPFSVKLRPLTHATSNTWKRGKEGFLKLLSQLKRPTTRTELAPAVRASKTRFSFSLSSFSHLPRKNKTVLILIVILIAAFTQSIVYLGTHQEKEKNKTEVAGIISSIDNKIAEISAGFLYGDDNRVRVAITALQNAITDLPDTKEAESAKQKAQTAIQEANQKLQRVREIASPEQVADVSQTSPNSLVTSVTLSNNDLILLAPQTNSAIRTTTNGESSAFTQSGETKVPRFMVATGSRVNILNQDLTMSEFNPTSGAFSSLTFPFTSETTNIAGMSTYAGKIYLLDVSQNQIFKFTRIGSGYNQGAAWISEQGVSLAQATDISIDGSIYVLFENGEIKKFTQGKQEAFSNSQLPKPIAQASQLWTSEQSDRIFILDQGTPRLIILDKKGNLIEQLQFPSLKTIEGFTVDTQAKLIYILSNKRIYKVPLQ
jgi:hypothetical protein